MQVLAALLHCGHEQTRKEVHAELLELLDQPIAEWSRALVGDVDSSI